eukprot:COSAG02_NODE_29244_length_573_cov_0.974684_1_plen_87_part_00
MPKKSRVAASADPRSRTQNACRRQATVGAALAATNGAISPAAPWPEAVFAVVFLGPQRPRLPVGLPTFLPRMSSSITAMASSITYS